MNKILLSKNEIFDVIVNCYQTDSELVSKFHVTPGNLSVCVDRTVSDLINNDVNVYKVEDEGKFIGYFGDTDNKFLNGFFVLPKERSLYTPFVWDMIKDHFNNNFKTAVFNHNERAVKFLQKNGCKLNEVVNTDDGIGYIFSYEVEKCH